MAVVSEARPKNQPTEQQLSALLHTLGDQLRAGAFGLEEEVVRVNSNLLGDPSPAPSSAGDEALPAMDWIVRSVQIACATMNYTQNLLARL